MAATVLLYMRCIVKSTESFTLERVVCNSREIYVELGKRKEQDQDFCWLCKKTQEKRKQDADMQSFVIYHTLVLYYIVQKRPLVEIFM